MSNKITPAPWEVTNPVNTNGYYGISVPTGEYISPNNRLMTAIVWSGIPGTLYGIKGESEEQRKANAEAIVSSINNTYGKGINPEAVPELLSILTEIISVDEDRPLFDQYDHYYKETSQSDSLQILLMKAKAAIGKATIK